MPRARHHAGGRRGLGAGRRGRRRRARRHRHLFLVGEQVPALGVGCVVPVRRARGVAAHRRPGAAGLLPGLARYRQYLPQLRQTPFTPAVSSFFALETALDELYEQGGVPARRELYFKRNARIRRVFTDLGFSRSATPDANRTRSRCCGCPTACRRPALRRAEGARLHHLPGQGRPRRAAHPGLEHGRAARRDHRRVPGGGDRRRPRRPRERTGRALRAQVRVAP